MKILIVTHYFYPHIGGIETVAYNQARELVKQGQQVVVITSQIGSSKKEELVDGIRIIRIKALNFFETHFGVPYPIFCPGLISYLNREIRKSDLIHVHGALWISSFLGILISGWYKKPVVLTQHSGFLEYKNKFLNLFELLAFNTIGLIGFRSCTKILVLNPKVKQYILDRNIPDSKLVYLFNGVDTSLFYPVSADEKKALRENYELPNDKNIVLFVGRLIPTKGFDRLFGSRDSRYLTIFVGEGSVSELMKKDKDVRFLGSLSQKKLNQIYQLSDVFVLPSVSEGFPMTIQEAMASGLPVITTKQPGYEMFLDARYIRYIGSGNNEIKNTVLSLLSDKKLMDNMSGYARREAIAKISWESNVRKLLVIYKELVK